MFRPQKPTGPSQPTRHKLPLVERQPKQDDIATLFTGALRIRGTLFEMPIRPAPLSPIFIITCVFDHGCNETIWAMYEGSEAGTQIFNLPQSDLDMIFDMVVMACTPAGTSTPVDMGEYPASLPPYSATPGQYAQPPATAGQYPYQQPGFQPAQPYGAQAPYQKAPTAQPYGQQPGNPPPAPAQPAAAGADIPRPEYSGYMDLLSKGAPNLLVGHLLVESGLVSEKCLDTALKIQELVRKGDLTITQAVLAMRRASELGGNLDDDIIEWAKTPESKQKQARPSGTSGAAPAKAAAYDSVTSQRIVDLLKQAGLVTDQDLETAKRVRSKHGGDISQILVSAGKLSDKTVAAAAEVQNMVAVGRIRIDKAITALHYCERMRVGLKEAMTELSIDPG